MIIAGMVAVVLDQQPTGLGLHRHGTGKQSRRRIGALLELDHLVASGCVAQKKLDATITGCHGFFRCDGQQRKGHNRSDRKPGVTNGDSPEKSRGERGEGYEWYRDVAKNPNNLARW